MRFPDWPADARPPQLGDVIAQTPGPGGDPDSLQRAYKVVGVEETRTGYRVIAERIPYDFNLDSGDDLWAFFNVTRR